MNTDGARAILQAIEEHVRATEELLDALDRLEAPAPEPDAAQVVVLHQDCPHSQQAVVDGVLSCARCHEPLIQTGVLGRDSGASQATWAAAAAAGGPDNPRSG